IDACRACTVFYRRTRRLGRTFHCNNTIGNCVKRGRVLACRRCRFDLMDGILKRANLEVIPSSIDTIKPEPKTDSHNTESPIPASVSSHEMQSNICIDPLRCFSSGPTISSTSMLDRIQCGYNVMIRIRKTAELCIRPLSNFFHSIVEDDNTIFIAGTHG
ncbi:hypothetical protein PENTCL1PPCAC_9199, partial [Pristionchus entomophagus]